jgi:hypothetical protein
MPDIIDYLVLKQFDIAAWAANKLIAITILAIEGEWAYNTVFSTYERHILTKAMVKNGVNDGRFWLAIYAEP